jgi:XTP/dITP diphosphohydrolase
MKILYATSNSHKIESANRNLSSFNIQVEGVKVSDIQEIQSDSVEEISKNKAKQVYSQIKKSLIVSDSGWNIPSLHGFPGPMMTYVNRWFVSDDFLNLIQEKEDKSIILIECVTYIDGDIVKTFSHEIKGRFLEKSEGEGTSLDKVITFREDNKSVAKCQNENILSINQIDMWNELGEYLLDIKK